MSAVLQDGRVLVDDRVWQVVPTSDGGIVQLVDPATGESVTHTEAEIRRLWAKGTAVLPRLEGQEPTAEMQVFPSRDTDADDASISRLLQIVREIHALPPSQRTADVYNKAALELGYSPRTMRRRYKDYARSGEDPRSLVSKPRDPDEHRVPSEEKLRVRQALIEDELRNRYFRIDQPMVKVIADEVYAREVAWWQSKEDRHAGAGGRRPTWDATYAACCRRAKTLWNNPALYAARLGARKAKEKFQVKDMAYEDVTRPLQMWEMDHTTLDIIIVDDVTRELLGRPVLTTIVDVATRYPVALMVHFQNCGFPAVAAALTFAILPKADLTTVVPNVRHSWLSYGFPDVLVCDNGSEFHSKALVRACQEMDIRLQYCAPFCPWLKPIVESFQGKLAHDLVHTLPGTTRSNPVARGEYPSEQTACIGIDTLRNMIVKYFLNVYAEAHCASLGMSPRRAWEEGTRDLRAALRGSALDVRCALGLVDHRQIRHDGIWWEGIRYWAPELEELRRRNPGGVTIKVPTDDVSTIFVEDIHHQRYVVARARPEMVETPIWLWVEISKRRRDERRAGRGGEALVRRQDALENQQTVRKEQQRTEAAAKSRRRKDPRPLPMRVAKDDPTPLADVIRGGDSAPPRTSREEPKKVSAIKQAALAASVRDMQVDSSLFRLDDRRVH